MKSPPCVDKWNGESQGPPKGKITRTRTGQIVPCGAPRARASRVRVVEASSPPRWGPSWPPQWDRTAPAA
eukprot:10304677-Lingulodinium_polyedra.AAC.1